MNPIKNCQSTLIGRIKENKKVFVLFTVLRLMVIAALVRSIIIGNYEGALTCVLALLLFLVPSFLEGALKLTPVSGEAAPEAPAEETEETK